MQLKIEQNSLYSDKVLYNVIHGKHPYKTYLEIIGNCRYGRYIAIVSNTKLDNIDSILVKINKTELEGYERMNNMLNKNFLTYRVKEVDIFTVGDTPLTVFKPLEADKGDRLNVLK